MGQFAAAIPYIVGAASIGSGVYSAMQQRASGQEIALQYKETEKQEGDAARQREIDRRKNLLRALASQNAEVGAAGAEFSGSIGNAARVDIEQAADDSLVDEVNVARNARVARLSGREARRAGNARAATSLVDSAYTGYKRLG
jgi:hypothetical protein